MVIIKIEHVRGSNDKIKTLIKTSGTEDEAEKEALNMNEKTKNDGNYYFKATSGFIQ